MGGREGRVCVFIISEKAAVVQRAKFANTLYTMKRCVVLYRFPIVRG